MNHHGAFPKLFLPEPRDRKAGIRICKGLLAQRFQQRRAPRDSLFSPNQLPKNGCSICHAGNLCSPASGHVSRALRSHGHLDHFRMALLVPIDVSRLRCRAPWRRLVPPLASRHNHEDPRSILPAPLAHVPVGFIGCELNRAGISQLFLYKPCLLGFHLFNGAPRALARSRRLIITDFFLQKNILRGDHAKSCSAHKPDPSNCIGENPGARPRSRPPRCQLLGLNMALPRAQ